MLHDRAILYVEDDFLSREALEVVLRRVMGIEDLWVFEDSADFVNRLRTLPRRPDIVLLDINMKPYSGIELLKMLRGEPEYQEVVTIALTASVMSEQMEQLRRSGFNGAIGKPIDVGTFPELIERAIRGEPIWSIAA